MLVERDPANLRETMRIAEKLGSHPGRSTLTAGGKLDRDANPISGCTTRSRPIPGS